MRRQTVGEPEDESDEGEDGEYDDSGAMLDCSRARSAISAHDAEASARRQAAQAFSACIADMVLTGYQEGHPAENILMEIKGFKFSQNKVCLYVCTSLYARVYVCMFRYIRTSIHTYIETYNHTDLSKFVMNAREFECWCYTVIRCKPSFSRIEILFNVLSADVCRLRARRDTLVDVCGPGLCVYQRGVLDVHREVL